MVHTQRDVLQDDNLAATALCTATAHGIWIHARVATLHTAVSVESSGELVHQLDAILGRPS